ncbi:hypothetical protein PtB15_14B339 [Puccinia triticina]|nr:hypothetical protein PtB15_14B339 [Puccinia triticina]
MFPGLLLPASFFIKAEKSLHDFGGGLPGSTHFNNLNHLFSLSNPNQLNLSTLILVPVGEGTRLGPPTKAQHTWHIKHCTKAVSGTQPVVFKQARARSCSPSTLHTRDGFLAFRKPYHSPAQAKTQTAAPPPPLQTPYITALYNLAAQTNGNCVLLVKHTDSEHNWLSRKLNGVEGIFPGQSTRDPAHV